MEGFFYSQFADALKDTLSIIPFLLIIFFIIEILEYFYLDKIVLISKFSKKAGPLIGALLASIPQCGLSVVVSTLYCRHLVTLGTLISVYLATSDEAVPVLLANPAGYKTILPLVSIKIAAGLAFGYIIDFIFTSKLSDKREGNIKIEKGCHSHSVDKECHGALKKELFIHPVVHTLSVSFFVFLITFILNIILSSPVLSLFKTIAGTGAIGAAGGVGAMGAAGGGAGVFSLPESFMYFVRCVAEPILTAVFGLIPNCAVSVGITIMYLKGVISFASCVSGLCAGAGLGILVLIKNNEDKKDTAKVILLLLAISIFTGYLTMLFSGSAGL